LDERARLEQARLGIAGEIKNGNAAQFGVSGLDRPGKVEIAQAMQHLHDRDRVLSEMVMRGQRLGDRAARDWSLGVWFADYTYVITKEIRWRRGRENVFAPKNRVLPLFFDSAGYRREITKTAPLWAHEYETYPAAIDYCQPNEFAAWDYPFDKQKSLTYLDKMAQTYPNDPRLWPIFSIRWTWNNSTHIAFNKLPEWRNLPFHSLIPLTRTQKPFRDTTRDRWARQAIAGALEMAHDPDFRVMCNKFGKVMIGGLVGSACPRMARHLFAATLSHLFPGVRFWLLGQANFAVINGLGQLGLLETVSTDGSWWLRDATAERFAIIENGLITMMNVGDRKNPYNRQSFFTTTEMMAANLRSLLAAYAGEWAWPRPEPLPLDLVDEAQRQEMKKRLQANQLKMNFE
jgi:hypothetical protein